MTTKYRADIDGLRTVAILPVLLFHAGVPGMLGGFVGVDVFFVISGYLITAIIAREVDDQNFSIIRFYERRVRRILPALIVVMAAVLLGAAWLYFPSDFRLVPKSVIAALLFTRTSCSGRRRVTSPLQRIASRCCTPGRWPSRSSSTSSSRCC